MCPATMDTNAAMRTGQTLVFGSIIPALLVVGLLLTPVNCACGASLPHGHFLFQLAHHHHDEDLHEQPDDSDEVVQHESGFSHQPHPMVVEEPDCGESPGERGFTAHFALSNAIENDSAMLQAPPTSSFGQPAPIAQPSLIETPTLQQCDSVYLPTTRTLEGVATSPETPPPKV